MVEHTSDDKFEEDVLKADIPVIVDFYADWCGPCKMMAPVLEEVSKEYEGKLKVLKLDVQANQQRASEYGVRGIPNLAIFKDGKLIAQEAGYKSREQLKQWIDDALEQ